MTWLNSETAEERSPIMYGVGASTMSIKSDGRMVTNVCCHSNGYSSATTAQMHELRVLKKEKQ